MLRSTEVTRIKLMGLRRSRIKLWMLVGLSSNSGVEWVMERRWCIEPLLLMVMRLCRRSVKLLLGRRSN